MYLSQPIWGGDLNPKHWDVGVFDIRGEGLSGVRS